MFATNRVKAVVLPKDDRRFTIAPRQETKIEKTSWWPGGNEIERLLESEVQSFVWFLKSYKVDRAVIGSVIQNQAKKTIQALSQTNAEEFFEALNIGNREYFEENLVQRPGWRGEDEYIDIRAVWKAVSQEKGVSKESLCRLYNYLVHPNKPVSMSTFGKAAVGYLPPFKTVRTVLNVKSHVWGMQVVWK